MCSRRSLSITDQSTAGIRAPDTADAGWAKPPSSCWAKVALRLRRRQEKLTGRTGQPISALYGTSWRFSQLRADSASLRGRGAARARRYCLPASWSKDILGRAATTIRTSIAGWTRPMFRPHPRQRWIAPCVHPRPRRFRKNADCPHPAGWPNRHAHAIRGQP